MSSCQICNQSDFVSRDLPDRITSTRCNDSIIIGDFNIDIEERNESSVEYLGAVSEEGYVGLRDDIETRVTSHSATLIDHCFARLSYFPNRHAKRYQAGHFAVANLYH